jgi:hypothetical protein
MLRGNAISPYPESIATFPPFGPIEEQKWFDQISSQWESQKNQFAFISFGNLPPFEILLFMTTVSEIYYEIGTPGWFSAG